MSRARKLDIWMPLYIADYAKDTFHLTRDQHGGYLLLIMAAWVSGGRLPNDPPRLAAIAKATPREWAKLAPVLLPFFKIRGEWLVHKRISEERQRAEQVSDAKRKNGQRGGRPKSKSKADAKLMGKLTETHARVTVDVSTSEVPSEPPFPSEVGTEYQDSSETAEVIPLAARAAR